MSNSYVGPQLVNVDRTEQAQWSAYRSKAQLSQIVFKGTVSCTLTSTSPSIWRAGQELIRHFGIDNVHRHVDATGEQINPFLALSGRDRSNPFDALHVWSGNRRYSALC